mmetsp:Transcript_3236/g.6090  ORF Transcript_3236/g.6090 Transcript_3236/m.6090 type:complete len:88 (+) Transcript_3236:468-731(+)
MVQNIYDKLHHGLAVPDVPVVVVGNQVDLTGERAVATERGRRFAASIKCPFVETSAKTGEGIAQVFKVLLDQVEGSAEQNQAGCVVL